MDLEVPGRYPTLWQNLPVRLKAAVCLFLPVPFIQLCVVGLGILKFHRFELLILPAACLLLIVFLLVLNAAHRRLRDVHWATDQLRKGERLPQLPPYSWETNAIQNNLERLVADLDRRREESAGSRDEAARLFESAPAAYLETDVRGTVIRANQSASRLLGRPIEDIRGVALWDVLGAAKGPAGQSAFRTGIDRQEAAETFDQKYTRPDGAQATFEIEERLLRDRAGAITGTWCMLTDRTPALLAAETIAQCDIAIQQKEQELVKALAEAAEARLAESRFQGRVSHDLRAPLNTIVGFAELLLDGKVGNRVAERRECLQDILASARELSSMVDRLLDQSRRESVAELAAVGETVDVQRLVHEVGYRMQALSPQGHGARIQLDLDPQVRFVTADREALRQLVAGYLLYAGRMVHDGGPVVLRTIRADAEGCRLEVEYHALPAATAEEASGADHENTAELAHVNQFVEKGGGRTGVQNAPGGATVLYAVLPEPEKATRRKVASAQSGLGDDEWLETAERLRQALEVAGIRRDCGKPVLVAGRTPHGVKGLTDLLVALGQDPIGLPGMSEILWTVERERPAAVVVDAQNGAEDYEVVRAILLDAGIMTPVVGFRAEIDDSASKPAVRTASAAASPERQTGRSRLRSLAGGGRKRSA